MPDKNEQDSSWNKYQQLILVQMETNTDAIKELGESMHILRNDTHAQLGNIRVQMIQEMAQLESKVGISSREEVRQVRRHLDEEITKVQDMCDKRIAGISANFESRLKDLNMTLKEFVNKITADMERVTNAITALNIKAGMWGAGGSILGVIAIWALSKVPQLIK
jgi:hypothetical protein